MPGIDTRIDLGGWAGPVRVVRAFEGAVGDVLGGQLGSGQASSIVVQYVDRLPW